VTGGAWVGAIPAVLLVAAAAIARPWARLAGVAVATAFAVFVGFAVIGFRTSTNWSRAWTSAWPGRAG